MINHKVYSSEFEFHRLVIPMKTYKLGSRFKEILSSGDNTNLLCAHEDQIQKFCKLKYSGDRYASKNSQIDHSCKPLTTLYLTIIYQVILQLQSKLKVKMKGLNGLVLLQVSPTVPWSTQKEIYILGASVNKVNQVSHKIRSRTTIINQHWKLDQMLRQ